MKVEKISCKNFRNIENAEIIPCDRMNVICGENAQGKTNFLEAIWLFTGAKSFRGGKDAEFVKFGETKALISMDFISEGIKKEAEIEIEDKRTAFLNQNKLKAPASLAGSFNAIIFSPADLKTVGEGPAFRRKFLDTAIGQLYPSYIDLLRNYLRAVTQRNKIIKDFRYDSTLSVMLDVFEEEMASNGEKIIALRQRYVKEADKALKEIYSGISSGKEALDTAYVCTASENFTEKLKASRKEDMYKGTTSVGPHRDDLDFKINGISARNYASQGQKRSVALSLKLAEATVLKKQVGESPTFLLDDVMSELDIERQNFILNHIKGMQAFITCCDPTNIKNLESGRVFNISKGMVSRCTYI